MYNIDRINEWKEEITNSFFYQLLQNLKVVGEPKIGTSAWEDVFEKTCKQEGQEEIYNEYRDFPLVDKNAIYEFLQIKTIDFRTKL